MLIARPQGFLRRSIWTRHLIRVLAGVGGYPTLWPARMRGQNPRTTALRGFSFSLMPRPRKKISFQDFVTAWPPRLLVGFCRMARQSLMPGPRLLRPRQQSKVRSPNGLKLSFYEVLRTRERSAHGVLKSVTRSGILRMCSASSQKVFWDLRSWPIRIKHARLLRRRFLM